VLPGGVDQATLKERIAPVIKPRSCDEVGINDGSCGGIVLTACAAEVVCHKDIVAKHSETIGLVQPSNEVGVNHSSSRGVVFGNLADAVAARAARHKKVCRPITPVQLAYRSTQ
jgi:hypothetical protein